MKRFSILMILLLVIISVGAYVSPTQKVSAAPNPAPLLWPASWHQEKDCDGAWGVSDLIENVTKYGDWTYTGFISPKVAFNSAGNATVVITFNWSRTVSTWKWGPWIYGYDSHADENSCSWFGCWHRNKIWTHKTETTSESKSAEVTQDASCRYVACTQTSDLTAVCPAWPEDWTWNESTGLYEKNRTCSVAVVDAYDATISCGSYTYPDQLSRAPEECEQRTERVYGEDIVTWDPINHVYITLHPWQVFDANNPEVVCDSGDDEDTTEGQVTPASFDPYCSWDGEKKESIHTFTAGDHVTLTMNTDNGPIIVNPGQSASIPTGSVSWSAVADEGYFIVGEAEGQSDLKDCKPIKAKYEPPCPTCDLVLPPNTEYVGYCTASGPVEWKSLDKEGSLPAGVRTSVVINSYQMDKLRLGWTLDHWLHAEFNLTQMEKEMGPIKSVEILDHGKLWPMPDAELRQDGNMWSNYWGRVCNVLDTDQSACHSSHDFKVLINGVQQLPYTSIQEGQKLWYPCWECSLTPSFAMTKMIDGVWKMQYGPGMNSGMNEIFAMKNYFGFPEGFLEGKAGSWTDASTHDALEWATNFGHEKNPWYPHWSTREYNEKIWEWFPVPDLMK